MGYSCSALAAFVCDHMFIQLQSYGNAQNTSNGWTIDNQDYFFERGREQNDGSITGSVYGPSAKGPGFAHKVGTVKISADGKVVRWATSNANQRNVAELAGKAAMEKRGYIAVGSNV